MKTELHGSVIAATDAGDTDAVMPIIITPIQMLNWGSSTIIAAVQECVARIQIWFFMSLFGFLKPSCSMYCTTCMSTYKQKQ